MQSNKKTILITAFILFAIGVAYWTYLNGVPTLLTVYREELIYYCEAQGIVQGRGISVVYGDKSYELWRYIYKFLIAPAFLVEDRLTQFRLLGLINSTIYYSGLFPIALLANRLLKSKYLSIMVLVMYAYSAHSEFTVAMSTDPIFYVIIFWAMYFLISYIQEKKTKYIVYWGISAILLLLTKRSAIVIVIASILSYIVVYIKDYFKELKVDKKKMILGILTVITFIGIFAFIAMAFGFDYIIYRYFIRFSRLFTSSPTLFAKQCVYYFINVTFTLALLPLVISIWHSYRLDKPGKVILIIILEVIIAFMMVQFNHNSGVRNKDIAFIEERYIGFLEPLICIVFFKILESFETVKIQKKDFYLWMPVAIYCVGVVVLYRGTVSEVPVSYLSLLYMHNVYFSNPLLFKVGIIVITIISFVLFVKKPKWLAVFVLIIFSLLQVRNHKTADGVLYTYYLRDDEFERISITEDFIKDHQDSNFIIMHKGDGQENEEYVTTRSNRLADTYLNYPNTIHAAERLLMEIEGVEGQGINLLENRIIVPLQMTKEEDVYYNCNSINYILVSPDTQLVLDNNELIRVTPDNSYFEIYELQDSTHLPAMSLKEE